jgi:hypothetical protein
MYDINDRLHLFKNYEQVLSTNTVSATNQSMIASEEESKESGQ